MPTASRSRKVGGETCRLGAAVRKKSSPVAQPREISHIIIHNALYTDIYMLLYHTKRGEQYFREEYINVTENVAVNRYCSLCAATYIVAR